MTIPPLQMKDDQAVMIGIGEYCVGKSRMSSIGLGSCVALILYDEPRQTGAMAHVMLPESREKESMILPGKFADTAVPELAGKLVEMGARKKSLKCKIAGGATMFEIPGATNKNSILACGPSANIGQRNVEAVKRALSEHGISLVGEDTGGKHGRTVRFDTSTGEMVVSSIYYGRNTV